MESQITRRDLIRSVAGTTVVRAVGISGLFSLLANRQAVAAGNVFQIEGITGEVGEHEAGADEPAHRHTFSAGFTVKEINPDNGFIIGDLSGRTFEVISTGHEPEDEHVHLILVRNARIEDQVNTTEADEHFHRLNVD
jgi:hypothetical protein